MKFFSKFQIILSFSNYGHSVLFLTEQDRMPNFFFGLSNFCINCLIFLFKFSKYFITWFLLSFYLLIVISSKFQKARALLARTDQFENDENQQNWGRLLYQALAVMMKTQTYLLHLSAKSPMRTNKVWNIFFSAITGILSCSELNWIGCPTFFWSFIFLHNLHDIFFKFWKIPSFSNYVYSVLLLM